MAAGRRVLLAYLVYFTALGASFPYLPVFYRDLGLRLEEIGLLIAIQAATQLACAPVWGGLADRFPHTRMTLPLATGVAIAGGAILFGASDFTVVLTGSMLLYAGLSGVGTALDARTFETLGPTGRHRYGQVRAFGSLAFVVSTLLVGLLLDSHGSRSLFLVYLPALLATLVVTAMIPRRGSMTRSINILSGARDIVVKRGMGSFFVGMTVVWAALSATNTFYSIQIVALGGNASLVGLAWSFGALIEVPIMFLFPRLGPRFGTERLLILGAIALGLRAFLTALATDPIGLLVVAPLEGFGFACVFVGGVTVLAARAPAGLIGTAQGLFAASAGLAAIIGSMVGGGVAGSVGIPGLFASCGLVGFVGAAILAVALRGTRSMDATAPQASAGTPDRSTSG